MRFLWIIMITCNFKVLISLWLLCSSADAVLGYIFKLHFCEQLIITTQLRARSSHWTLLCIETWRPRLGGIPCRLPCLVACMASCIGDSARPSKNDVVCYLIKILYDGMAATAAAAGGRMKNGWGLCCREDGWGWSVPPLGREDGRCSTRCSSTGSIYQLSVFRWRWVRRSRGDQGKLVIHRTLPKSFVRPPRADL